MRRGYTLVEVLAAVAVVSLLAGLTFPVLARARRSSETAVCLNQLHQVWLGYRLAALDRGVGVQDLIAEDTYRYLGGDRLWRCITSSEEDRRYYLRLPLPERPDRDLPLVGDPYHDDGWLWVTLEGSVRVSRSAPDRP